MDDVVLRAMARWPDVPAVFGWLSLDQRGQWRLKNEVIKHQGSMQFISRNYVHDATGRWFFQNGPQRVFVRLDYTPLVFFLDPDGDRLRAHTGAVPRAIHQFWLDDAGSLLIESDLGIGLLYDQDLAEALERMQVSSGRDDDLERALEDPSLAAEFGLKILWREAWQTVRTVPRRSASTQFAYVPDPEPD